MSFSVFEKIDPSCQNGSMEKAKNIPYHQRPYASIAERTLVDISIYSPRPQIAGTGHSHSKISIHSPRMGRDSKRTQLFEEKNWRICTTLYLFASKEVLPADKKTF